MTMPTDPETLPCQRINPLSGALANTEPVSPDGAVMVGLALLDSETGGI